VAARVRRKVCFKCGHLKALSEFYVHPQMADGHLNKCKECAKSDSTAHRNANLEKVIKYDRDRYRNDLGTRTRAAISNKKNRVADPKRHAEYSYAKRRKNPVRARAQAKLGYHVRKGNIVRQPCEKCGAPAQAHHDDYSKPLDVRWLCPTHHGMEHRKKD
jgi:hypothetical protein